MSARAEFSLDDLVPHRFPMRFLDAVGRAGPMSIESSWTVPQATVWRDGATLRRVALLEFAAQTAAAYAGFERAERGLPPLPGYLGGVDDFVFHGDAAPGEEICCRIDVRFRMGGAARVTCRVVGADGRTLALGDLSLVTVQETVEIR